MANIIDAYNWAVNICNSGNYRYSQTERNSYRDNPDTGIYFDCSSFICYALIAGGFDTQGCGIGSNNAFTTYNMPDILISMGFTRYDNGKITTYQPGDIGYVHTSVQKHTEMFYNYGNNGEKLFMGAHSYTNNIVSIRERSSGFPTVFRYEGDSVDTQTISYYVIAAIAGNMAKESTICPNTWESGEVKTWTTLLRGYGLGQWTNTDGDTHGRLYQLYKWLTDNGYDTTSGEGQVAFLIHENVWYHSNMSGSADSLKDFMYSESTNLANLTEQYLRCWEGIYNDVTYLERYSWAQDFFKYIPEHIDDNDIVSWQLASNNYVISESAMRNNAVMLARYLQDAYGTNGVITATSDAGEKTAETVLQETGQVESYNVQTFSIWDMFYALLGLIGGAGVARKLKIKKKRK